MNINQQSMLTRNPDIIFSEIDGETVMMDLNFEDYFGMDTIGSRVWQLLEKELTIEQLCNTLMDEYEVSYETCLKDLTTFLKALAEQEMISILD